MAESNAGQRDERMPAKSVLELRRTEKGLRVIRAEGDRHVFTPSFLERQIEQGGAEVAIRIKTQDGDSDLVYHLVGFERVPVADGGEPRSNLTAWIVDRVEE